KKIKRTFFIEEKGLTLVEVLASFVILSIVLVIFLSIFIQSAKTNQTSEEIVDATYIAQTEMELIYEESLKDTPMLTSIEYDETPEPNKYKKEKDDFFIEVELINFEEDMKRIIIKVY